MNKREEVRLKQLESMNRICNSTDIMNTILMQYGKKEKRVNMDTHETYSMENPNYEQSIITIHNLIKQSRDNNFPVVAYRSTKLRTRFYIIKKIIIRLIGFVMSPQGNVNDNILDLIEELIKIIEMNQKELLNRINSLENELLLIKSVIKDN